MDAPVAHNRLEEAESPYLRQHADNPVNWQPWDDAALAAAREQDRPIFLSVGYSACHWCHVMEEESFQDESVAAILNESFVPIKVDREQRPDLDRIYQTVCQQVSGRGGWPLSAWLTPEGKPFYVGTYFPREPHRGTPGFLDVLESIRESWTDDREDVEARADQWTAMARQELEAVPGADAASSDVDGSAGNEQAPIDEESSVDDSGGEETSTEGTEAPMAPDTTADLLLDVAEAVLRGADRTHGGFGSRGPKFPQPPRIDVLLRAADRTGRDGFESVATLTLDRMANGGLYDHLGGGFHRYSTDREWVVPHFEKMLYDNAELPRVYADAYRVTGSDRYAEVVEDTLAFVESELRHPDGGCYSTLNAQSPVPADRRDGDQPGEPEEGAYYVWTPEEVRAAVGDNDLADLFCERYGVTPGGNFEGRTVLTRATSVADIATDRGTTEGQIQERLAVARQAARDHRQERPSPSRDEKVIAAWNGLLIGAAADASLATDAVDPSLAVDALAFVREQLWDGHRLARRYKDGDVAGDGYLEDYAFLGRGAIRCFEATGDVEHLALAFELAAAIEAAFWDAEDDTLYFTPADGEQLIARPQEPADQSTPSSLGVAVEFLWLVDTFRPDDRYRTIAERVVETYRPAIDESPLRHPTLGICADRIARGGTEITVALDGLSEGESGVLPPAWRRAIGTTYLPNRVLAPRPATDSDLNDWLARLGLDEVPPIWDGRGARDDEPTAYVCREQTCSPPLTDPDAVEEWIGRLGP